MGDDVALVDMVAEGDDHRLRAEVPDIEPFFERWVAAGRNLGSMVARTIVLLDAYGAPVRLLTQEVGERRRDGGEADRVSALEGAEPEILSERGLAYAGLSSEENVLAAT